MVFNEIVRTEDVILKDAILLEGLPGVGNVGKLAATHLIEELKAKKCMEIYSSHFPPQVLIDEDGKDIYEDSPSADEAKRTKGLVDYIKELKAEIERLKGEKQ